MIRTGAEITKMVRSLQFWLHGQSAVSQCCDLFCFVLFCFFLFPFKISVDSLPKLSHSFLDIRYICWSTVSEC